MFNPEDKISINVNDSDSPIVYRQLFKHTKRDIEIHTLPIPSKPLWLNFIIRLLRFYQKRISPKLGNRCVFDPSCSRYSEEAYRKKGFFKGTKLTFIRLLKCRSGNGGVDLIK